MATATGTLYLRPSADISLNHPVVPDTLGAGYLAINEAVSDGEATYIGGVETSNNPFDYTSTFRMALDGKYRVKNILSAKFIFNGSIIGMSGTAQGASDSAACYCTVTLGGKEVFYGKKYDDGIDTLTNADMPDFASALNDCFASGAGSASDVVITIRNTMHLGGGKAGSASYTSQVAIEVQYEYALGYNIYDKVNDSWSQVTSAYKKSNGEWVETAEEECKSILASSLVIR